MSGWRWVDGCRWVGRRRLDVKEAKEDKVGSGLSKFVEEQWCPRRRGRGDVLS